MDNNIDGKYSELLSKILSDGRFKGDRTGTGTLSIFTHTLDIDISKGFPLLTTKQMFTKGIIHELLWFLDGGTNIRPLVKNNVNIWNPDAYKKYVSYANSLEEPDYDVHIEDIVESRMRVLTMFEFKDRVSCDVKFADRFGELGPIYGKQWVNWGEATKVPTAWNHGAPTHHKEVGINQIQEAIDLLNHNPDSRRIIISAWNVAEISKMTLPPCHWAFELYTEELTPLERFTLHCESKGRPIPMVIPSDGEIALVSEIEGIPSRRLSLKWHQRSVDTFLGLPFNIASYAFLLHMFAQQTNMVVGRLVGDLTNVHIYRNHINQCTLQINRFSTGQPKLKLKKAKDIFSYSLDDFEIVDYAPHPSIKGQISV